MVAEKVLDLFEMAEGTSLDLARAGVLISAICKTRPHYKFKVGWKALDVWRTKTPAVQAPAIGQDMALAAAMVCIQQLDQPEVGVIIVLCFCGLLRVSEALNLKFEELLGTGTSFVAILGRAKRGLEQKVVYGNPGVIRFLRGFSKQVKGKKDERIFQIGYTKKCGAGS